jgi:hypothetical protein
MGMAATQQQSFRWQLRASQQYLPPQSRARIKQIGADHNGDGLAIPQHGHIGLQLIVNGRPLPMTICVTAKRNRFHRRDIDTPGG